MSFESRAAGSEKLPPLSVFIRRVESSERLEDYPFPVWTDMGAPDSFYIKHASADGRLKSDCFSQFLCHFDSEWNFRNLSIESLNAPQFSLGGDYDSFSIWRPAIAGVRSKHRPRLLGITVEAVEEGPLLAGGKLPDKQNSLCTNASDKGKSLCIGGNLRRHGTTHASGDRLFLANLKIKAVDGVNPIVRVSVVLKCVSGTYILRIVKHLSIRT